MQVKIPLFSTDVGKRIAYLRERCGVTLETLGAGRPTTAQSWEQGKMPRRAKWQGIAERLGLSESFIFLGRLETDADYAFIAKWRNEIEGADALLAVRAVATQLHEEPGSFHDLSPIDQLKEQIHAQCGGLLATAGDDISRLGWLNEELGALAMRIRRTDPGLTPEGRAKNEAAITEAIRLAKEQRQEKKVAS